MPVGVKHKDQIRFQLDMEPDLALFINNLAKQKNIPRTKLLRMMVKYSLHHIPEVLKHGDISKWRPNDPVAPISDST